MDDLELDLLDIHEATVKVGQHNLKIETLTLARQKSMVQAFRMLDLNPLAVAVTPILVSAADNLSFAKALADNLDAVRTAVLDLVGGDVLGKLASVMLDVEVNYRSLREPVGFEEAKRGRFNLYISSADLREYVEAIITPGQAWKVVQEGIRLSNYAALGKAAVVKLTSGMQVLAEVAPSGETSPSEAEAMAAGVM